ncbi:hypothetical protein [Spirosoma arcticum]
MGNPQKLIGIYHEHPDWFRPLFAEVSFSKSRVVNHISQIPTALLSCGFRWW